MNDFTILLEEIILQGAIEVWNAIEEIECPFARAIERQTFFEVLKTFPYDMEKITNNDAFKIGEEIRKEYTGKINWE